MADILQAEINIEKTIKALEQKFATGATGNGIAPVSGANPFAPFHSEADGIIRYKQADNPTIVEATDGGLFVLAHKQPAVLEWVMMDLSSLEDWTVSIVTSAGSWQVGAGTGERYVLINPLAPVMPGENVKVTFTTATSKPWVRIYVRSDQARRY